eukprot:Sro1191_g250910.2  (170) ;mRNA; r:14848-15357
MMAYQRQFPELGLDFENAAAPTVTDVAKVYPGPVIYVGMFAWYGKRLHREAQAMIDSLQQTQQQGRTNLRAINGRQYITALEEEFHTSSTSSSERLPVYECSTDTRHNVSTCITDTESYRFRNGHRCMGQRGGHPDLIAWDLIDSLHDLLEDDDQASGLYNKPKSGTTN